jgi:transposase
MELNRVKYTTDLTDEEWKIIQPFLPKEKNAGTPGRPPESRREIMNGIRYLLRTGCAWRMLPNDLPKWGTCYYYFRTWKNDGTWMRVHERLRGDVREQEGRNRQPSAAIIDSQSIKMTEKGDQKATTRRRK